MQLDKTNIDKQDKEDQLKREYDDLTRDLDDYAELVKTKDRMLEDQSV